MVERERLMAGVTVPLERIDAGAPSAAPAHAILVVDDIVKRFETPDGVLTAVDHVSFSVAPGEFVGHHRPLRLRQIDLVQRHRRAARRLRRHGQGRGRARARAASIDRHDLPGGVHLPLAQRASTTWRSRWRSRACRRPSATTARGISCGWSGSTGSSGATRRSCPAACASASRWRARSPRNRKSC